MPPLLPLVVFAAATLAGCSRGAGGADANAAGGSAGAVEVRTVRDASTGAELPRIALAGRPEAERLVNASLDSLSASLTCGDDAGPNPADSSFVTRASVAHAGDDVLSVSVHSSYYCGGAYPTNDANQSVTYDLTTGAAVPFETLFRDYTADRDAIVGVLQSTLYAAGVEAEPACADVLSSDALTSAGFAYALTGDGLAVQPEFPHVTEACAVESVVPYSSLRAFAAEGGVLARVADASGVPQ